jgi:HK97 family phage major capsid protein
MKINELILNGVKTALTEGKATIDLKEQSNITGSGSGVGGRVLFDDAFAAARYINPFRQGSRQIVLTDSDAQFVAKTGNAANATNPWGYTVSPNSGSPNIDTSIWQLPVRVVSAQIPLRTAVLSDVNALDTAIVDDLMAEFSQLEAASMALNDDQAGSTTVATGATSGLRGLATYAGGTSAAFGTSGTGLTNGIHTIKTVAKAGATIAYDDIVNVVGALPAQYWAMPGTAWHIHPDMITALRALKVPTTGIPFFLEVGDEDGGAVAFLFGFPVVPNPYLDINVAPMYLANWPRFMTIGDFPEIKLQRMEQTQPGFINLYGEKRVVSTVRDVFAGIRFTV